MALTLALALAAPAAPAQSNQIPGLDVALGAFLNPGMQNWGRVGAFPGGTTGVSISTTSCNLGSVPVTWLQAMDENHPFIAFMVAREHNGRIEQISDRSYAKHAFCALSSSDCQSCGAGFDCSVLAVGCSDTYSTFNNGDQFWLGPPDEIDPWLGAWEATCSYFDQGSPAVAAPNDCNGQRSLTGSQVNQFSSIQTRIQLRDADLMEGDNFYYQGQYVVRGEPENNRNNNLASRRFTANFGGNSWNFSPQGGLTTGSVLQQWPGATIRSGKNGANDGAVYTAVEVTGPFEGLYHYEYAVHNRDNTGGIGALRIPVCGEAQVLNAAFRDIDQDGGNDWSFTRTPTEIVFSTGTNALRWNTLYNFSFDSDAAPASGSPLTLDQFQVMPGANASFTVGTLSPTALFNVYLGAGCSDAAAPKLYATGSAPQATIGNLAFELESSGHDAGGFTTWAADLSDGAIPIESGCIYYGGAVAPFSLGNFNADGAGVVTVPVPIPADATLEGMHMNVQVVSLRGSGGPLFDFFDLSNGLRVRIGDSLSNCP